MSQVGWVQCGILAIGFVLWLWRTIDEHALDFGATTRDIAAMRPGPTRLMVVIRDSAEASAVKAAVARHIPGVTWEDRILPGEHGPVRVLVAEFYPRDLRLMPAGSAILPKGESGESLARR